jgi:hypothetical protein
MAAYRDLKNKCHLVGLIKYFKDLVAGLWLDPNRKNNRPGAELPY